MKTYPKNKSSKISIFIASTKPKTHLIKSKIGFILSKGKARKSKK